MKILKKGDMRRLVRTRQFNCAVCGCVFEADESEYSPITQYNEIWYNCHCPYCDKLVLDKDALEIFVAFNKDLHSQQEENNGN